MHSLSLRPKQEIRQSLFSANRLPAYGWVFAQAVKSVASAHENMILSEKAKTVIRCSGFVLFFSSFDWQETITHLTYIWPFYNMTKLSNRCLLWVQTAWTYDREANNNLREFHPSCFSGRFGHTVSDDFENSVFFWKVTLPTSSFWIWSLPMASKQESPLCEDIPWSHLIAIPNLKVCAGIRAL